MLFVTHIITPDKAAAAHWFTAVAALSLLPLLASAVDLATGISASKRAGNFRTTSWGLRRTFWKAAKYEAVFFMGALIDAALSFVVEFPAVCGLVAIAEVLTEYVSVKENLRRGKGGGAGVDPLDIAKSLASVYGVDVGKKIAVLIDGLEKVGGLESVPCTPPARGTAARSRAAGDKAAVKAKGKAGSKRKGKNNRRDTDGGK